MTGTPGNRDLVWKAAQILAQHHATSEDAERTILTLRATDHRPECAVALRLLREAMRHAVISETMDSDETEANHGRRVA